MLKLSSAYNGQQSSRMLCFYMYVLNDMISGERLIHINACQVSAINEIFFQFLFLSQHFTRIEFSVR